MKKEKGFTLLVAIVTTSLLFIVSFMVVNLAVRQLIISNTNQESQYSFYNADSGVECATFWDIKNINTSNPFNPSTPANINCNGSSITPTYTYSGMISTSTFVLPLTRGCAVVDVTRNQTTGTTTINSRGYNLGGAGCTGGALRRFERGVTSSFPSNSQIPVNVTWQNVTSVTASSNNLTATVAGWGNAGASSAQSIVFGNGYVEFSTSENNIAKAGALTNGDPDRNYTSQNYSIILNNSGGAAVYENGTGSVVNTYVAGDIFRIEIKNGVVNYYKNGVIMCGTSVCSHAVTPTYPLIFDTSFNGVGATIINAKIAS